MKSRDLKNKEFFEELDRSKKRIKKRSGFSCLTFFIMSLSLLMILEICLFLFVRNINFNPIQEGSIITKELSGLEQAKFSKIENSESQFEVIVSEGVLCQKIAQIRKIAPSNISCKISSEGILISGKISPLLTANASALIYPEIKNNKLSFITKNLSIGKVSISHIFTGSIINSTISSIESDLDNTKNARVSKIDLEDGIMVIWAEVNKE